MEVSSTIVASLKAAALKSTVIRLRSTASLTTVQFNRIHQAFRASGLISREESSLEIIGKDNTLITGSNNISTYCRTGDVAKAKGVVSLVSPLYAPVLPDYNIQVFALSLEAVPMAAVASTMMFHMRQSFRFQDGDATFILRVTKRSKFARSYREARFDEAFYEVLCELPPGLIDSVFEYASVVVKLVSNDPHITTEHEKLTVLNNYFKLADINEDAFKLVVGKKNKSLFLGPNPITLEEKHLLPFGETSVTIQRGYTVTDKADGERMMLFFNTGDGRAFYINNRLDVRFSGHVKKELAGTLIDGEYITKNIIGDPMSLFAAFDLYYLKGKSTLDLPLAFTAKERQALMALMALKDQDQSHTDCRLTHLKTALKDFDAAVLRVKNIEVETEAEGGIFSASRKILEATYEYETDGLIYTPRSLGLFCDQPKKRGCKRTPSWNRVFKWKPPQLNTVDFLVRQGASVPDENGEMINSYELLTGFDPVKWDVTDPMKGFELSQRPFIPHYERDLERNRGVAYRAKKFDPPNTEDAGLCFIPQSDKKSVELMRHNTIVEMRYDLANTRWLPLREREDKTEVWLRSGNIGNTANDYGTALSTWRTIHDHIDSDVITGETPINVEEIKERTADVYYDRVGGVAQEMRHFHNWAVKRDTIYHGTMALLHGPNPPLNQKTTLLEVCCGQAGDARSWKDARISTVVGVDMSRDNILNVENGAYSRVCGRDFKMRGYRPDVVFAIGDCAYNLGREAWMASNNDPVTEMILNCVFAGQATPFPTLNTKFKGIGTTGFDIVACQFAIHYFCTSDEQITAFLANVASYLKPGGYFVGTCMDGAAVRALFETNVNGIAAGLKEDGAPIWQIERLYDPSHKDEDFGAKIEVFLEMTNKKIEEYLVPFESLVAKALAVGLKLHSSQMFSELHATLKDAETTYRMSPVERRFSFLNRWFRFQKV